ncbi:hypothetical protein [Trinickia dinghuensis]|uniref:Uncharacterized protein n=1 Tax=Trinickia dinghuensis TaxID=2291023 RepID=A0A3D8K155_9BURK|nr:hypothetical protein [Trinickia dinghuensis]RDU99187.1 hypothetical protein DWV00_08665 [Trinickia dinghuensis]
MEQLQQAVANSFAKIVESGAIEQAIDIQLSKTVKTVIDEELRAYGSFGEQLKEHVKKALEVNFDNLGLPGYNDLILKIVRQQVDAHANNAIAAQIEAQLGRLLEPAPAQITLSELVKSFIESNVEEYECSCAHGPSRITLQIEPTQYGSRWVRLDKEPGKDKYECAISFLVTVDNGRISALRIGRQEVAKTLFVGLYGFERKLFQMYAAGTRLVVDAEEYDINTSYPDSGD